MHHICKIALIKKLASGAKRRAGGINIKEIFPKNPILVFYNQEWPDGIEVPPYMKDFQQETRQIDNEEFTFLFQRQLFFKKLRKSKRDPFQRVSFLLTEYSKI